jgi:ATP-dependent Lon protease
MRKRKNENERDNVNQFTKLMNIENKLTNLQYFKNNSEKQKKIIEELNKLNHIIYQFKPQLMQLIESDIPIDFKAIALRKFNQIKSENNESFKLQKWLNTFLRIPFYASNQLPIQINNGPDECKQFINNCEKMLNDCTYGMHDAKYKILQLIGKWMVNPKSLGTAIALKGPMGTGKTTLVKYGISKILNRPFGFITLGGANDSGHLEGHSYTYEGSTHGKIIDILIETQSTNPIIFFDELDKVAKNDKGNEVIGILTHLTDTTQNNQFHDKYFSEIDFDLSKCLFIFSYNDESLINPILRDRMYVVDVNGYTKKDKIIIFRNYLLPSILKEFNLEENIEIDDSSIEYLIEITPEEEGVRNLKRNIETLISKINLERIQSTELILPYTISIEKIKKYIPIKPKLHNSMYI